jgi:ubiquinone/menaquinone biosynthesis C-methylase UbiE
MNHRASPAYALGHSEEELERLIQQAELFEELTRQLFVEAGIREGMRVLDLGCGVGDVSFLAARFVGPSGHVIGMDRSNECLEVARDRALFKEFENVTFIRGDLAQLYLDAPVDAVVGRFVLMYLADPAATLRRAAEYVQPGGVIAIQELDTSGIRSLPELPLFEASIRLIKETLRRSNVELEMGLKLYQTFIGAGLGVPHLSLSARVEGGKDSPAYDYFAQTVRSLLPAIEDLGVSTSDEVRVETLAERLRAEALSLGGVVVLPPIVRAWARKEDDSQASLLKRIFDRGICAES